MIGLVECDFEDEGLICVGAGIAALQMTGASDVRPAYLFDILSAAHGFAGKTSRSASLSLFDLYFVCAESTDLTDELVDSDVDLFEPSEWKRRVKEWAMDVWNKFWFKSSSFFSL